MLFARHRLEVINDNAGTPVTETQFPIEGEGSYLLLEDTVYLWKLGDFDAPVYECMTVQSTVVTFKKNVSQQRLSKTFASLMFQRKVNAALLLLDQ